MKKFAIGHYSAWDNTLTVEIIESTSMFDALHQHSTVSPEEDDEVENWINEMEENNYSIDEIKENFSNLDQAIDIVEI